MLEKFLKGSPRTSQREGAGAQLVLNVLSAADLVTQASGQKPYSRSYMRHEPQSRDDLPPTLPTTNTQGDHPGSSLPSQPHMENEQPAQPSPPQTAYLWPHKHSAILQSQPCTYLQSRQPSSCLTHAQQKQPSPLPC